MLNYVRPVRSWARASSEFRVSGKNVKTIEIERKQAVPISRKKVSDLANILPPEINPIYELRHERPNTSVQDYDAQGNLKPLPPIEIMAELMERFEESPGPWYENVDEEIWETYRRPDSGPERNLSKMEQSRKQLLEDVVNLEAGDLDVHSPEYFRSEVEFESKRLTSFTRGMGLVNPAMQPLPQGYFNYDTDKIETLPEQFLLNLVGYNHLHLALAPSSEDKINEKLLMKIGRENKSLQPKRDSLKERLESNFSVIASRATRSSMVYEFADSSYLSYVEDLQSKWAEITGRSLRDIIQIQNQIIDCTHLNHIEVNWLFEENWKVTDMLKEITHDMAFLTFQALKQDSGITFGADLGLVLANCPEFLTLDPRVINDRKNSFIGWDFDGEIMGNLIRYSPNAFLNDNYDEVEAKIQYLVMRCNAPRDVIAEIGLLDVDIREISGKYEFLYRRGIIHRPSKKERRLELKKRPEENLEKHTAEKRKIIGNIYLKDQKQFLEYAQSSKEEFDIWMRSWNSEIDECDGLATNTIQALLGMKIPFVINKDFIKSSSYATEKEKIMKRDLGATTTKQIVWEIEEEEGDMAEETPLYRKLIEFGQENFTKFGYEETGLINFDLSEARWRKKYIKISRDTALDLMYKQKFLDESLYT